MANPTTEFVRNLAGAYPRFPMSPETRDLYVRKLMSWNFTPAQWAQALDIITEARAQEQSIPTMGEMLPFLRAVRRAANDHAYGWLLFTLGGRRTAMRVYAQGGEWMELKTVRDGPGEKYRMEHSGRKAEAPQGATQIRVVPDAEARTDDLEDHHGDMAQILNHYGEVA